MSFTTDISIVFPGSLFGVFAHLFLEFLGVDAFGGATGSSSFL
jgi:hypothetical protein